MFKLKSFIESLWYEKILRNLLYLSRLGRTSIKGQADSGLNFDYMYRHSPKGITPIGEFIDKFLLNLPSVKATRHRKEIIIKILQNEIANNLILRKKTRILDLASGPARYLVELISKQGEKNIEILCVDKDRRSLNLGKILSKGKPIRYTKADVQKLGHLKELSRRITWVPNIVLISGLFEYKDDIFVKRIITDVYDGIEREGLFIFISQEDNLSKKLMSKLGVTSEGKKWELVYRKPDTFRAWLIETGFKNIIISTDEWGMYEFCTCRK